MAALLAGATAVLTGTLDPVKAFGGFANASVLLVIIAFLVAQAVVKCGLGKRISLYVVSLFGKSTLGLAYSIFITDALIAPGFPSNTARAGVLYPIILSLAQSSGSVAGDESNRRLGGSQNVIFVASDYLTQGELYRLGLITTVFCLLGFLTTPPPVSG